MLGWRSSGFSPAPSAGGWATCTNGLTLNTSSAMKKVAIPARTAVAYGTISRWRFLEPAWLDHIAVIL
jgi:hypothetical protein